MDLIPNPECPMCHGRQFSVVDSYPINPVTDDYRRPGTVIKRSIATVAIVCVKCGFISQHSMAVMGLKGKEETKVEKEEQEVNKEITGDGSDNPLQK